MGAQTVKIPLDSTDRINCVFCSSQTLVSQFLFTVPTAQITSTTDAILEHTRTLQFTCKLSFSYRTERIYNTHTPPETGVLWTV
jgi:hypothetical protein